MKVQSNVYIFHTVHYLLYRKRKKAFLLLGIFKIVIKEPPALKNLLYSIILKDHLSVVPRFTQELVLCVQSRSDPAKCCSLVPINFSGA